MTDTATEHAADSDPKTPDTRVEPNPRWIRGVVGDRTVVDSRDVLFVWEIPYYPQWYFPLADLAVELRETGETTTSDTLGTATVYDVVVPGEVETVIPSAARMYRESSVEAIRDRVRFTWDAIDTWLEEEVEVSVHPRSPYTRVDVLPSTKRVTVKVDGEIVAESERPFILYETGLRPRYYLDKNDVRSDLLTESNSSTACPYKGVARYWDVTVNGVTHEDLVWGYDDPLPESALVKDLVCFYNERVEISVDGEPESA